MAAKRSSRDVEPDFYSVQENSGNNSNVPAFLMKLWTLVEDPSNNDIICWDVKGKSFHIFDQSRFAHEVLPFYFKHNNISSFIRQLNMYGFRKVVKIEQGGLKMEHDDLEFQHMYFQRGEEQLLDLIKRRSAPMKAEPRAVSMVPDELGKVLSDVTLIKGKQDTIATSMVKLKRENEALWREVAILRQKHAKQQQIVNKLLQFLLSLVNSRRGMPGLQRKRPLMINSRPQNTEDGGASPAKRANVDVDETGDHDYTVQSPSEISAPPSASSVVIHELLDHTEATQLDHNLLQPINIIMSESADMASPLMGTTATSPAINPRISPAPSPTSSPASLDVQTVAPGNELSLLDQALLSANLLPQGGQLATSLTHTQSQGQTQSQHLAQSQAQSQHLAQSQAQSQHLAQSQAQSQHLAQSQVPYIVSQPTTITLPVSLPPSSTMPVTHTVTVPVVLANTATLPAVQPVKVSLPASQPVKVSLPASQPARVILPASQPASVSVPGIQTANISLLGTQAGGVVSPGNVSVATAGNRVPGTVTLPTSGTAPAHQPAMQPPSAPPPRQHQQKEEASSKQIALRGVGDKPLSSATPVANTTRLYSDSLSPLQTSIAKATTDKTDMTEQIDMLQSDLDSLREALSSGQYSLDPNFLVGLFDPQSALPVSLDQNFLDSLTAEDTGPGTSSITAPGGSITGQEVWQYQPRESFPDLFDTLCYSVVQCVCSILCVQQGMCVYRTRGVAIPAPRGSPRPV
ncbi:heat shock factor protein 4-like isoform X2 [Littorina saxatilis]|uniref:heat shock factor protein 4-like isoform X2 n=1 Tax=Littorina saxatilis TaxID=31220 RepID=UPI0038B5810B